MDELCIEGWLHRSKKGDPTQRERRYFFSSGFAVEYCKTPDRASRTGKFDLRMVEELDEPEPGMLFVRVKGKTHPLHVFLPSPMEALQQGDGADAKAWRMLWASAVDESVVSLALESARDTNLAERFTMLREEKRQTRALLAKPFAWDTVRGRGRSFILSPADGEEASVLCIPLEVLDANADIVAPETPSRSEAKTAAAGADSEWSFAEVRFVTIGAKELADMVDWPVEQQRYTLLLREGTSGFEPDDSTPQGGLAG
ncbi:hypothetical protein EMIHUDRAFT_213578 [Emiliania huxleyi CCMP1516]|uniref:PH domain-containing protein n=2 Tax=Emiliania huxleyi TaxID=2903 RepID=A0A0D3IM78_EMIH1|nr:hypothetical protein EMIHUDRAFT_213578 [Emiliania huxleyi CCMP1516]EOD12363.1 hypothetical protein EMIHUDRAFT_213578 [Emiliania huxleyi CCMP1516]|eukprot:XP_005764792.1 hypothetical protein EMIHUDRAFT_213578 [Emiliania huxleyi CCMP1516]